MKSITRNFNLRSLLLNFSQRFIQSIFLENPLLFKASYIDGFVSVLRDKSFPRASVLRKSFTFLRHPSSMVLTNFSTLSTFVPEKQVAKFEKNITM